MGNIPSELFLWSSTADLEAVNQFFSLPYPTALCTWFENPDKVNLMKYISH
jgi:hypothetical protein